MTVTMSADKLRTELLEMGESEESVAKMKKPDLAKRYLELMDKQPVGIANCDFDFEADGPVPPSEGRPARTLQEAIGAPYGSSEWQDYIMAQFREDELVDGCPKCNGMRRIAQLVLGDIISSKPVQIFVVGHEPRTVTVAYEIVFDWKLNTVVDYGNIMNMSSDTRVFGGLADCTEEKTVYGRHPAATAESKAEARALRKALALNVVTAEEKLTGADEEMPRAKDSAQITKALAGVLKAKMSALKLDADTTLKEFTQSVGTDCRSVDTMSMEEGRKLLAFLNKIQQAKA